MSKSSCNEITESELSHWWGEMHDIQGKGTPSKIVWLQQNKKKETLRPLTQISVVLNNENFD